MSNEVDRCSVSDPSANMAVDSSLPSNDGALPDDCFEACAMVLAQTGRDYPAYRPTGIVDAAMVARQVDDCFETLHVASLSSGLAKNIDKLKLGFEQYSSAVTTVMEHLKTVASGAKNDFERVCESKITQDFGLTPSKGNLRFIITSFIIFQFLYAIVWFPQFPSGIWRRIVLLVRSILVVLLLTNRLGSLLHCP